jgi:hypothetical protein
MIDYLWAEKFVEFTHDVEVECWKCDITKTIKDAELAGNRHGVSMKWTCDCGQQHYSNFDTNKFTDER